MTSADSVVSKILELDSQAEAVKAEALQEANRIRDEYLQRIEREKESKEREKVSRITQVRKAADEKRKVEIERVREEFAEQSRKIDNTSPEKLEKTVNDMVARVKGIVG